MQREVLVGFARRKRDEAGSTARRGGDTSSRKNASVSKKKKKMLTTTERGEGISEIKETTFIPEGNDDRVGGKSQGPLIDLKRKKGESQRHGPTEGGAYWGERKREKVSQGKSFSFLLGKRSS